MSALSHLKPERVFYYFEQICAVPRGSGNQEKIKEFCMDFAERHSLRARSDEANNVVIYKKATVGYEDAAPIILQGHLDMVCQKENDCDIDFLQDGIRPYVDGDEVKALHTTLGADNGIAVAMILAILEDEQAVHPALEAVFTTDEEIGMIGADKLSVSDLSGRRMINLDSEDAGTLTVSCAGGSDCEVSLPIQRTNVSGTKVIVTLTGLKGGHSGVEIHTGRINADRLAGRVLCEIQKICDYQLLSVSGGDKGNAIPREARIELVVSDAEDFVKKAEVYFEHLQSEMAEREPDFVPLLSVAEQGDFAVLNGTSRQKVLFLLLHAPNGVMQMSATVDNLVETSLNLGIFHISDDCVDALFSLRSNQSTALSFLEERLLHFAEYLGCKAKISGYYPPWEFCKDSVLQRLYQKVYREMYGKAPIVTAIHAGLECAVFASKIRNLDCISIGPDMKDVHTVNERLSISSTEETYRLLLALLKECKE